MASNRLSKTKVFFSTGEGAKPLETKELIEIRRENESGYDEIVDLASEYVDANPKEFPGLV